MDSRGTGVRIGAAICLGIALVAVWPAFSAAWIALLKSWALPLAGGRTVLGPMTASPTLAVCLALIAGTPLPLRLRVALAGGAAATALGFEAAVVTAGAASGVSAAIMSVLSGLAQDAVPLAWLVGAFAAARRRSGRV